MKLSRVVFFVFAATSILLAGCSGKKEESPTLGKVGAVGQSVDVICSYAPSQSDAVTKLTAAAGGSAVAAASVAQAAGLTAVLHSSGAYIFTGASGYVAGTIGAAAALPVVVTVGVVVGGSAATLELLCAAKNHPALVSKVEAAASELFTRTK